MVQEGREAAGASRRHDCRGPPPCTRRAAIQQAGDAESTPHKENATGSPTPRAVAARSAPCRSAGCGCLRPGLNGTGSSQHHERPNDRADAENRRPLDPNPPRAQRAPPACLAARSAASLGQASSRRSTGFDEPPLAPWPSSAGPVATFSATCTSRHEPAARSRSKALERLERRGLRTGNASSSGTPPSNATGHLYDHAGRTRIGTKFLSLPSIFRTLAKKGYRVQVILECTVH